MAQNDLISIIILSWNRKNDVRQSLLALREQDYTNLEIVIVDNGSQDGTSAMVMEEFPEVRLLSLEDNIGVAACNLALQETSGKYVVILDDDSFPEKKALGRMVDRFEKDKSLGAIAFSIHNFCSIGEGNLADKKKSNMDFEAQLNYAMGFNGAGAGFRRAVLMELGFYPGEFFLYMNEMDLSLRMLNAGYVIGTSEDIVAYHKYSPQNRTSWRAPYYYTRNTIWLLWKYYPMRFLVTKLTILLYMILFHSFEQKTSIYLKAFWHAWRDGGVVFAKRTPVRPEIAAKLRMPLEIPFTFYK